tara:strand:- start:895 stop:1641 length:747 start_codon:yes stop_codon:yes gene_type:complete
LAFLGDLGKVFGLGSSKQVLGGFGETVGNVFGIGGTGRRIGETIAGATDSLASGTADQPLEQSAVPTPGQNGRAQETSRSGSQTTNIIDVSRAMDTQQAGLGVLTPFLPQIAKIFGNRAVQTGLGAGAGILAGTMSGDSRERPVLTQSRRNKARVRQLVNFLGIEGTASFLSQQGGVTVTANDVVALLLRTFRNDGAYITKAQVRNLRRTTNRFKSLEKQVKEAVSMGKTTRRASPMRRASSTTLIKN